MFSFLKDVKIIPCSSPTTGTNSTSMASKTIDMAGYNSCAFVHTIEASSVATQVTVQASTSTTAGDFATLTYNSSAAIFSSTVANGVLVAEIVRLGSDSDMKRYLRTLIDSTGVRPYGGTVAYLFNTSVHPTTQSSTDVLGSQYINVST